MTVISNSKHLIQQAMRLKCCLRILLGAGLLILVIYLILVNELLCNDKNGPQQSRHNNIIQKISEGPCQIPKLNPFDESIRHLINIEKEINCTVNNHSLIFGSNLNSHLIVLKDPELFGYKDCCYMPFYRNGDKYEKYSSDCFPIGNSKSIRIPTQYEFIAIYCHQIDNSFSVLGFFRWLFKRKTLVDMFSFIHADSPKNIKTIQPKLTEFSPNIVILGIDSVSRTNFLRSMPQSYEYLTKDLSAIGMDGYGLFAENTFANLVPALTGLSKEELISICWQSSSLYFDNCKFIWELYSSSGYITGYAEDYADIGIFRYEKNGFKSQPTDYYLVPLINAFYTNSLVHGGNGSRNLPACYGPRLGFEILLNNIKEMAIAMKDRKYFQFTWETSLCHENPNYGGAGDNSLLELLQWFKHEQRLESTILILMSDHGARFNALRQTEHGRLDVKMPFLYFLFPSWFSKKYELAVENIRNNSKKLTTPFDLHETLKDLSDLSSLENTNINLRQANLKNSAEIPRGMSLFLSLPDVSQRKCQEAKIPLNYCFCSEPVPLSVTNSKVRSGAKSAVSFINKQLKPYPQCATLVLDEIISAQSIYGSIDDTQNNNNNNNDYDDALNSTSTLIPYNHPISLIILIKFKTLPNKAIFEAALLGISDTEWVLSGDIARINKYGNQARCVSVYSVKNFCYCD